MTETDMMLAIAAAKIGRKSEDTRMTRTQEQVEAFNRGLTLGPRFDVLEQKSATLQRWAAYLHNPTNF